jgi:hypothetical protein
VAQSRNSSQTPQNKGKIFIAILQFVLRISLHWKYRQTSTPSVAEGSFRSGAVGRALSPQAVVKKHAKICRKQPRY